LPALTVASQVARAPATARRSRNAAKRKPMRREIGDIV
jgi:hypothetical protein